MICWLEGASEGDLVQPLLKAILCPTQIRSDVALVAAFLKLLGKDLLSSLWLNCFIAVLPSLETVSFFKMSGLNLSNHSFLSLPLSMLFHTPDVEEC